MHASTRPGAKATPSDALLDEGVEQVGRIGHESSGLLDRVPGLGFLAMHALVRADTLDFLQAEDAEHARLHPGSRPIRMFVQEISTSRNRLSIQIAAPFEMQPACSFLTGDDQRAALPRNVVDGLDR